MKVLRELRSVKVGKTAIVSRMNAINSRNTLIIDVERKVLEYWHMRSKGQTQEYKFRMSTTLSDGFEVYCFTGSWL